MGKAEKKDILKGIVLVNTATFAWATNIILGRYIRSEIGPITLTASRYLVASLVFVVLFNQLPASERKPGKDFRLLAAMAATGVVLFAPVLYLGLRYTSAVNGTLINGLGPLFTALFAAWLIKEPFTGKQFAGSFLALSGVAVLISGASISFFKDAHFNPGDLIIILAVVIWGLYSVAVRKTVKGRSPLSATALSIFMGLPVLLAAAAFEVSFIPVSLSPALVAIIVYIGIVPAALGFFCWNAGIEKLGAGGAMVFYNTMPLYGALLGFVFLGEKIGIPHIAGGTLIIAGALISAMGKIKKL